MVRLKDRYLLVNIIYSDVPPGQAKGSVPDLLLYNQPTTSELRPQLLLKGIRSEVAALFGDCGSGAVDRSLQGNQPNTSLIHSHFYMKLTTIAAVKYLSPATSTFILRVSRAHYRLVWAAVAFMNRVPVRDGRPCVFRVVRVSGTVRKVEEEAVRRAKLLVLAAKDEMAGRSSSSSDALGALLRSDSRQTRTLAMVGGPEDPDDVPGSGEGGGVSGSDDG
jgi:ribonuclease P/MRP protein subunit POP5